MYNLHDGCTLYNMPSMVRTMDAAYASNRNDGNPYCNQGIASLGNATYVASVSKHGIIHILRARDGSRAGSLKISGNIAHSLSHNNRTNSLIRYTGT